MQAFVEDCALQRFEGRAAERHGRRQAIPSLLKRCKQVVVANIDAKKYETTLQTKTKIIVPKTVPCPEELKPSPYWINSFNLSFEKFRQNLLQFQSQPKPCGKKNINLPSRQKEKEWQKLCFSKTSEIILPTPILISQFDEITVVALINYYSRWMKKEIITQERAIWLYVLFGLLSKPLLADTAASLRDLYRRFCFLRTKDSSRPLLPALTILITIITSTFGQGDPEDD